MIITYFLNKLDISAWILFDFFLSGCLGSKQLQHKRSFVFISIEIRKS